MNDFTRKQGRGSITFACLMMLFAVGCGGEGLVSVSGTVTHDGKPLENVFVVFTPQADGDNHFPGPASMATTDSNGKFSLKTQKGSNGAVVGKHQVGFTWADVSPFEMGFLQEELATAEFAEDPDAARARAQRKIDETEKKMASRPSLNANLEVSFEVPSGGTSSADFDLSK